MFSTEPGTPGRRQQMPRMTRSICTPALLASYSASTISGSPSEFILDDDATLAAERCLVLDEVEQLVAQVARRDEQRVVVVRPAVAGEVVEQLGDIVADRRIAGEEADVFVQARGARVVVAGADVAVATQPVVVGAHHQHALGVGLQADEAVHDVHAGTLERLGPCDVGGLVEASLELDQHGNLHAALGGADEAARDGTVAAGAVQRHLDALHPRVVCGLGDERLDAAGEALVGVMSHQRAFAYDGEDAAVGLLGGRDPAGSDRRPRPILQVGTIEGVQLPQAGEVERCAMRCDIVDGRGRARGAATRASPR